MELDEPLGNDTDPLGAHSLWYQWRAENDGWMTFDTSNPIGIDTIVVAYTGSELSSLQQVAYGDDSGGRKGGRISVPVKASTNYFLAVAAQNLLDPLPDVIGSFTLSWYPTPVPSLTAAQFAPKSAMPGAKITLFGTNFTGATEVLFTGARADFIPGLTNNSDLRITATIPPDASDGPITIRTPHGDVTSSINFVVLPPPLQVGLNANGRVEVSWPATTFMFVLEAADDLREKIWRPVAPLVLTNGSTIFRPEPATGNRFYRLTKRLAIDQNDPRGIVPVWEW